MEVVAAPRLPQHHGAPTQDVCTTCGGTFWKHWSGVYFKWCNGFVAFKEIHAFAGNLTAAACDEGRAGARRRRSANTLGICAADDPMEDSNRRGE